MREIENPCFHCYQGAIGECIRCEHGGKWWSGDLGAETIEVDDDFCPNCGADTREETGFC